MQTKIDKYFAKKGIGTIFNFLGHNPTLVHSFISNYRDLIDSKKKQSQYEKLPIYNSIYEIAPRHKMTGFESLSEQDVSFRQKISKYILEPQHPPLQLVENKDLDSKLDYKQNLVNFAKSVRNPLIYLSGGIDSELAAKAFLDAGIKPKFVIFEWLNNGKHIINAQEVFHAYRFCKKYRILPIIKQINVEELWQSTEFEKLAIDIQLVSPQLVTYAHMINIMNEDLHSVTHVFGGEVRFKTNYLMDDGSYSNIVYLDKTMPEYNGVSYNYTYSASDPGAINGLNHTLVYNNTLIAGGYWYLYFYTNGPGYTDVSSQVLCTPPGSLGAGPFYGTWTTTPWLVAYEARTTYVINSGPAGTPPTISSNPSWINLDQAALGGTTTLVVDIVGPQPENTNSCSITWTIDVRVVGQTTPVVTSSYTVSYNLTNTYVPEPPPEG